MKNELFPEVQKVEPSKKTRKPRKKTNFFSDKENNRRYKLHPRVKIISEVTFYVRKKLIETPVGFEIDNYPAIKELVEKFKYQAPTLFK